MENNLRKIRESKGISRWKMAKEMQMGYYTLDNWEKSNSLAPAKVKLCADYLGVNPNEIIKY